MPRPLPLAHRLLRLLVIGFVLAALAGGYVWRARHRLPKVVPPPSAATQTRKTNPIVQAARDQIDQGTGYDGSYVSISYPGGDVPITMGACTDVVIRALRKVGVDLQKEVHEDIKAHWDKYPRYRDNSKPDANIDHRRVPNLRVFFRRHGQVLPTDLSQATRDTFQPGDIVTWKLPMGKDHIGILTDKTDALGWPCVVHNIGAGPQEEDVLGNWELDGHYRYPSSRP